MCGWNGTVTNIEKTNIITQYKKTIIFPMNTDGWDKWWCVSHIKIQHALKPLIRCFRKSILQLSHMIYKQQFRNDLHRVHFERYYRMIIIWTVVFQYQVCKVGIHKTKSLSHNCTQGSPTYCSYKSVETLKSIYNLRMHGQPLHQNALPHNFGHHEYFCSSVGS